MKNIFPRWFANRKNRIERRLDKTKDTTTAEPQLAASNIHYEVSDKANGLIGGGIGAIHLLARRIGLIDDINRNLHLLKVHLPYHESDHVLNFAYNALCNGTCLQDIELRRTDENFLDALGTRRIPDPTTAGDFCRRFTDRDVETLIEELRTKLLEWSRKLLDEWEKIAKEYQNDSVQLQYQREVGAASPLLHTFLDPELKKLPPRHRRFRANRSMRDVEPSVNLWVKTLDDVPVSEDEE